jgi:uncharacterized cofD-like protein
VNNLLKKCIRFLSNRSLKMSLDTEWMRKLLSDKKFLVYGPKIVAIGGGTGLSTMLRGLKEYSANITAVVTVADDGGGSGVLRQDLGLLPPGDIRNCLLALANTEPIMEQLLQYRFQDGMLKGQSFGNLFIAAMNGISDNFVEAVRKMSDVLAVTGRVLPVTINDVRLVAELEDGFIVKGESNIGNHNSLHPGAIKRVFIEPSNAQPLDEVIESILEADAVILGPGSLFTSIIPNLLIKGVADAIKKSPAIKIYVCNIMTQPGETDGFNVLDHVRAVENHSFSGIVDYCIVNQSEIPEEFLEKYRQEGAEPVLLANDSDLIGTEVITDDYLSLFKGKIRHDAKKLSKAIMQLVDESVIARDKQRLLDYYFVKERL